MLNKGDILNIQNDSEGSKFRRDLIEYVILIGGLFLTYLISLYNYLLFHSIIEIISIVISGGIFLIGWHSRKYMNSSFFLILGISVLFISAIDLIHTLAYSGMGVFTGFDANLPTQLWIVARYWQALSYLFASLMINKKIKDSYLFVSYIIIFCILLTSIFQGFFPVCYIEGPGLTPFKIISEYVIDIILFVTLIVLYKHKEEFDPKIFLLIVISIIATIISELAFTFYIDVFDFSNYIGHVFKIIAFFFIYKAIIELGIETPFDLLFRKLKLSEEASIEKANQLEQAYSEFNQMFNASLPLRVINKDYEITRVNDTYASLFRVSKEDLICKKCYDLRLGYENRCNTELCSKNQIQNGKDFYEYELVTNFDDGSKIVSLVRTVPYKNTKGDFIGIIQNFTDITERSKFEVAMKKSEEKYKKLVEDSLEGIWVIDDKANTTFINQSMANMFGYDIDEMIGTNLYEFMDKDGKKIAETYFERRRQGIEEDHEFEFIHKSGKKVFTTLRASPIIDKDGNFKGAMAFVTDVTDQKLAQEKIADMARFHLENPNPVLRVSNKYILLVNNMSRDLLLIGEGSKIPKFLREHVNKSLSDNLNLEIELNIKDQIYTLFIVPIKDRGYANIYGMNITARREAEKSLERFVSTVSHELRTPISVLIMSLDFLDNHSEKVTLDVRKKLQEGIKRNIYLLKDLVDDILALSKIDEGKIKLKWEEYNPLLIIKNILTLMEPIGNANNIKFDVDIDEDIKLYGDPIKFDQILRIFIDNAIKYSKENKNIEIKAINHYKGKYNSDEKDGVLFQIKDYGIGILEEDLPSIFQRFFRSEQVSDIPGTGLGLSIAKELLKLHNGEVWIQSDYGKGSTFFIFLPIIKKKNIY